MAYCSIRLVLLHIYSKKMENPWTTIHKKYCWIVWILAFCIAQTKETCLVLHSIQKCWEARIAEGDSQAEISISKIPLREQCDGWAEAFLRNAMSTIWKLPEKKSRSRKKCSTFQRCHAAKHLAKHYGIEFAVAVTIHTFIRIWWLNFQLK